MKQLKKSPKSGSERPQLKKPNVVSSSIATTKKSTKAQRIPDANELWFQLHFLAELGMWYDRAKSRKISILAADPAVALKMATAVNALTNLSASVAKSRTEFRIVKLVDECEQALRLISSKEIGRLGKAHPEKSSSQIFEEQKQLVLIELENIFAGLHPFYKDSNSIGVYQRFKNPIEKDLDQKYLADHEGPRKAAIALVAKTYKYSVRAVDAIIAKKRNSKRTKDSFLFIDSPHLDHAMIQTVLTTSFNVPKDLAHQLVKNLRDLQRENEIPKASKFGRRSRRD